MLKVDRVEGKERPKESPECGFEKKGWKTFGLHLCMLCTFVTEECTEACWKRVDDSELHMVKFIHTKPLHWHFLYCHIVDYHNNLSHSHPSIKNTWKFRWWPAKVLAFVLVISEVNAFFEL